MIWREVTVRTAEEAVEPVANFLQELGSGGVVIEEGDNPNRKRDTSLGQWYELPPSGIPEGQAEVRAYFAEGENIAGIVERLEQFIREIREYPLDVGEGRITVRDVKEEDWATGWKKYFKPVRITERLTIKPTWEEYRPGPEEIVLELDPGMAFGTGTHATTALCLRLLERYVKPGVDVIDVGTGSGILAIAAAKLGARAVLALDLDPVAVSSAAENVRINGLAERVEVKKSDLLQALKARERNPGESSGNAGGPDGSDGKTGKLEVGSGIAGEPDENGGKTDQPLDNSGNTAAPAGIRLPVGLVVANILAEIILEFVDDVYEALAPGGIYIASGVIGKKAGQVQEALERAGFAVEHIESEEDWTALVAVKRHKADPDSRESVTVMRAKSDPDGTEPVAVKRDKAEPEDAGPAPAKPIDTGQDQAASAGKKGGGA